MKIDFHTHIFPDAIAGKALGSMQHRLQTVSGNRLPTFSDATEKDLRKSMERAGIDLSVVLPVATSAKQMDSINEFAKSVTGGNILSFGSVFPAAADSVRRVEDLARAGFRGIKLHPEYQDASIKSKEVIDIINRCYDLGMTVVLHTGVDLGIEPPVRCTPKQMRQALDYMDGGNVVAAHLGGFMMWDDVEEYLVGTNIILDTSMLSRYMKKEQFARIIRSHGFDKIVCGSDSPWEAQEDNRVFLRDCGFDEAETEEMDRTAKRLLRL